jgi:endonuclease-3 related protein
MTARATIDAALSALHTNQGTATHSVIDAAWHRMVAELVLGPQQPDHQEQLRSLFAESLLQSPAQTAAASVTPIAEALAPFPRAANKAAVVLALAKWWLQTFGDELSPAWNRDLQQDRLELRQIRGLGPETVDRLLLFGAGRAVFPVDRGTLRVMVRHGWLDLPVEDDDAQSLFGSATGGDVTTMRSLARWLHRIGDTHCGRVPECAGCPLEPLLPPGGPIDPDRC